MSFQVAFERLAVLKIPSVIMRVTTDHSIHSASFIDMFLFADSGAMRDFDNSNACISGEASTKSSILC